MLLPNVHAVDVSGNLTLPRRTEELSSAVISQALSATNDQLRSVVDAYNALVLDLQNMGQLIPVVFPAVATSAGETTQLGNFRIPANAQVAIISAAVGTTPNAAAAVLTISYSSGTFGSSGSGQNTVDIVTTAGEFAGETTKLPVGELVFKITNVSSSKAVTMVSALLTLH